MNNQRIVVSLNLKRTIKIMKLTVLMLAVCLSSVVASTYAQTATLNVSAKNETLEKVLKQIEKQSEFLFFYNLEEINKNEKISINEKNANIQTVLDAIAAKTGETKKDAEATLNAFVNVVSETLAKGDKVQLVGFGSFEVRKRAARKGRNPQTKEEIKIPASKAPVFKAGKALKDLVNKK